MMTLEEICFDEEGLVPVIAQDDDTGQVLMVAYMNRESLRQTLETGRMTYWSRSRKRLWVKGEHSGHVQHVVEFRMDCDGDVLLFKVTQQSGACHTGYRSCFYRRWDGKQWCVDGEKVFEPNEVY